MIWKLPEISPSSKVVLPQAARLPAMVTSSLTLSCSDWSVYDKVLVGLDPSEGTGLVRIDNDISEPAHTVVMKITDNEDQVFVVESYRGALVVREEFSLASLVCATS